MSYFLYGMLKMGHMVMKQWNNILNYMYKNSMSTFPNTPEEIH